MKKQLQYIVSTIFMALVGLIGHGQQVNEEFTYNNITYRVARLVPNEVEVQSSTNTGDLTIPETVTYQGNNFSVTVIGIRAFENKGLTSVGMPNSIRIIGTGAFRNNALESVAIPENVTLIATGAFQENPLTSVLVLANVPPQLPANDTFSNPGTIEVVAPIGIKDAYENHSAWGNRYAFKAITGLGNGTVFTVNGIGYRITSLNSGTVEVTGRADGSTDTDITIPGTVFYGQDYTVTRIGNNAFLGNQLTRVEIPNSVTSIGTQAFSDNQLASVEISDSVTHIEDAAFRNNNLTSVTIGGSVENIGFLAFDNNPLTSVLLRAVDPPHLSSVTHPFTNRGTIDVVVPNGALNDYLGEHRWGGTGGGFKSITDGIRVLIDAPAETANLYAFTATFQFALDVTGFTMDDIDLTNATANNFTGSGSLYTVEITPEPGFCDGTITIGVPENVTEYAPNFPNLGASTTVTVNAIPSKPEVSSSLIEYCMGDNSLALTATGDNLLWYTAETGGTGSGTAPTPSTATTGSTSHYVSQTINGCESERAEIVVTINAIPSKPDVSSSLIEYCMGDNSLALTATGDNLLWYTAETGGTGSGKAPTPSTATTGSISHYVSQTTNGCESERIEIVVTVNAVPSKPEVSSSLIEYCMGDNALALIASGTNLLWYTAETGGTGSGTAPTPSTATAGSTSHYVSQTNTNGCESERAEIVVTVNAAPSKPEVSSSPVEYCMDETATTLTATGDNLLWYTAETGGTGSTTVPIPSTATAGETSYYVSQTNTNGCESERAEIVVTVNAVPSKPEVSSSLIEYCMGDNSLALTATGDNLLWYTTETGGTGSGTAPTPSTATTGSISHYVSQTTNSCESERAEIVVTVNAIPSKPEVSSSPVEYCMGDNSLALTATGDNLLWYTAETGGTGSGTAPTPSTATTGSTSHYVSQTVNGCESERAEIVVTVNVAPSKPEVSSSPVKYCMDETATTLTATGDNLLWYTAETGGTGSATAPTPNTTAAGSTSHYVSQTINGCESERAEIVVTVNAVPSKPEVSSSLIEYCMGDNSLALTATGDNLLWYTAETGGTGSATAPTPSTATAGSISHYVSQTTNGCESERIEIVVTVNAIPSKPEVSSSLIEYCMGDNSLALTATGDNLLWYTAETGGTGSTTVPIPSTATTGSTSYYVSQTTNGCESERAEIAVRVDDTLPVVAPTMSSNGPICFGGDAIFTIKGTPGDRVTYNGALSGTVTIAPTGMATITVNGATSDTTLGLVQVAIGGCSMPLRETATVTIQDGSLTVIARDITVELDASGQASITPGQVDNGSQSSCGNSPISLSLDRTDFSCNDVGTSTTVVLTATQGNNSATATAVVEVVDGIAPTAIAKDHTVQLDASGNATIQADDINNGSSDNCGIATVTVSPSSFDSTALGANIVGLTITDSSGNQHTATSTVTVEAYPAQIGHVFTVLGMDYEITSVNPYTVTVTGISAVNLSGKSPAAPSPASITIPETILYGGTTYIVTGIGDGAFEYSHLTSVDIGDNVTSIGANAFKGNQLTSVTIPEGVISIGANAFKDNPLAQVEVLPIDPPSIPIGDSDSFMDRSLIELIVPSGRINAYIAAGWTGFESISDGITLIVGGPQKDKTTVIVFPNPARDKVHIDLGPGDELEQVNIYTTAGAHLYSENGLQINTGRLSEGMYLFEIVTKTGDRFIKKIVIADR